MKWYDRLSLRVLYYIKIYFKTRNRAHYRLVLIQWSSFFKEI